MANSIGLVTKMLPLIDEIYRTEAKSAVLEAPAELVQETQDANVFKIAKMSMVGLGNYSKSTGFPAGDLTLEWETHTFANDRGRRFSIDRMDDVESFGLVAGRMVGEFVRNYVIPEVDAYRFAKIATKAGKKATAATLTDSTAKGALDDGIVALQESGGYTLNTVNVGMLKYNAYYNNTETTTTVVAGALIGNFDNGILANSAYQRNNITQINGEDESVSSVGAFGVRTSGVLINIDGLEFANIITMTSAEFINNTTINDTSVSNEGDTIDSNVLNINGEYAQFSKETGQAPTIVWVLASSSD